MSEQAAADGELLPVRMLNEYAYCPRLFHFMFVEGRWADNQYTVEGRHVHRRVDALDHLLPDSAPSTQSSAPSAEHGQDAEGSAGDEPPAVARSVPLSSEVLGLTAKLDLVAVEGELATLVESKRDVFACGTSNSPSPIVLYSTPLLTSVYSGQPTAVA